MINQSAIANPVAAPLMPIVGIGASAGGLDPICEFLVSVPPQSGFAYVWGQHLDPIHKCMLPELLQRMTSMHVCEITDACRYAPITSTSSAQPRSRHRALSLHVRRHRHGAAPLADRYLLQVTGAAQPRYGGGHGLFRHGRRWCAGVEGDPRLRRPGAGAAAIVARFEPMPSAAIAARAVDMVELPGQMVTRIAEWWSTQESGLPEQALIQREGLQQLFQLLLKHTGANFSDYKLSTVLRRIDRRRKLRHAARWRDYVKFMRANPAEVELLFKELLIGVTNFFRDPKVWEYLMGTALPQLIAQHPGRRVLQGLGGWPARPARKRTRWRLPLTRCWKGYGRRRAIRCRSSPPTLMTTPSTRRARACWRRHRGRPAGQLLQRYFMPAEKRRYRIRKDVRNMIIFASQNVISDPPFTKLDILCCRNLLIYFHRQAAGTTDPAIPLCVAYRRLADAGQRRYARPFQRAIHAAGGRRPHLPAAGCVDPPRCQLFPDPRHQPLSPHCHRTDQSIHERYLHFRLSSSCSRSLRRPPCCSTPTAISCIFTAAPALIWNRRRARLTGTFTRWRAMACATRWPSCSSAPPRSPA